MSELLDFIRARLDEDEQAARKAGETCAAPWFNKVTVEPGGYTDGRIVDDNGYTVVHVEDQTPEFDEAEHIVRWNPARVLAEVEAKRRMLSAWPDPTGEWSAAEAAAARAVKERIYRLLALPYADHPDYRAEWRP